MRSVEHENAVPEVSSHLHERIARAPFANTRSRFTEMLNAKHIDRSDPSFGLLESVSEQAIELRLPPNVASTSA